MFPSSTFSLLEDVSSAAVFELQHSVPLQFVQAVTEEMLDLLQEHLLLAQVSFTFTLHWQRITFSKIPGASSTCFWTGCKSWPLRFHFNFSGFSLCRSRVTHWQIYRWTRNAWKEVARLVGGSYCGSTTRFDSNIRFHLLKRSSANVSVFLPSYLEDTIS